MVNFVVNDSVDIYTNEGKCQIRRDMARYLADLLRTKIRGKIFVECIGNSDMKCLIEVSEFKIRFNYMISDAEFWTVMNIGPTKFFERYAKDIEKVYHSYIDKIFFHSKDYAEKKEANTLQKMMEGGY